MGFWRISAKRFPASKTTLENMVFSTFPEVFPSMTKFDFHITSVTAVMARCHIIKIDISKIYHEDHFLYTIGSFRDGESPGDFHL